MTDENGERMLVFESVLNALALASGLVQAGVHAAWVTAVTDELKLTAKLDDRDDPPPCTFEIEIGYGLDAGAQAVVARDYGLALGERLIRGFGFERN
jgi:hypothetical protein